MLNRILLILIVFLTISAKAQLVPGYQGKKTSFSYQINISPALEGPTYLNRVSSSAASSYTKAEESAFVPFNTTHGFVVERVIGRKLALSFNYQFAASKTYMDMSQKQFDTKTNSEQTFYFSGVKMNLYGHYFGGSLIFYGKRALAPFGKYFQLNFAVCNLYASYYDDVLVSEPTSNIIPSTVYTFETKGVNYGLSTTSIGFSAGIKRIYKDKIIFNRGLNLNIMSRPDYSTNNFNPVFEKLSDRMKPRDLISFYFGLGYLL